MKPPPDFLPELMHRGTRNLSYQQLRDELDRLKATLNAGGGGGARGGRGRGAPAAAGPFGRGQLLYPSQARYLPGSARTPGPGPARTVPPAR